MNDYLERAKRTAVKGANIAIQKTGEAVEWTKLSVAVNAKQYDLEKEYAKLGRILYDSYQDNSSSVADCEQQCAVITAVKKELEELEEKLQQLKKKRTCPSCGAEVSDNSVICAACGKGL